MAVSMRSAIRSTPIIDRYRGEKSYAVLISISSNEQVGPEGRPEAGAPMTHVGPRRRPASIDLERLRKPSRGRLARQCNFLISSPSTPQGRIADPQSRNGKHASRAECSV